MRISIGIRITKVEFQEDLSMSLSNILFLAVYINHISQGVKKSYAHEKLRVHQVKHKTNGTRFWRKKSYDKSFYHKTNQYKVQEKI